MQEHKAEFCIVICQKKIMIKQKLGDAKLCEHGHEIQIDRVHALRRNQHE